MASSCHRSPAWETPMTAQWIRLSLPPLRLHNQQPSRPAAQRRFLGRTDSSPWASPRFERVPGLSIRLSRVDAGDLANRRPWTTTSVLIKRAFDSPRSKLGLPCQRLATRVADVLKWNIL